MTRWRPGRPLWGLIAVFALGAMSLVLRSHDLSRTEPGVSHPARDSSDLVLAHAFRSRQSDLVVEGGGAVDRILPDDREGSHHQRFVVRLRSGQTLLVSHNLDLAPRVDPLAVGDWVEFRGEYEWNEQGGVLHWTHHDPQGRRPGGWIRTGDRTFR